MTKTFQRKQKLSPTESLQLAVQYVKENNDNRAKVIFGQLLKSNPKNGKLWLWYSKVSNDMKTIITAQKNAAILLPTDTEVKSFGRKIQIALTAGCPQIGEVSHCPFCWTPVVSRLNQCPFCLAHIVIHKGIFSTTSSKPDATIMTRAVWRYEEVIAVTDEARPSFNLGLAYLNLGKVTKAIKAIRQATEIDPDNIYYSGQLSDLLDYTANLELNSEDAEIDIEAEDDDPGSQDDSKKKVMIVEDSNTTRKAIAMMLSMNNFDVIQASNGEEALVVLQQATPDLILLDVIMPGLDGYQVLSQIKKNSRLKDIPVIMLSARDSLLDKMKGKMSSSSEYLTKPFQVDKLMEKLNNYL
jgi:twitching motility two-component system response regulator PilG